jgi:hypothetical protein
MMALPKKVRICGFNYDVIQQNDLDHTQGCAGVHLPEKLEIRLLSRGIDPRRIEQTFIHEVLHAVDVLFGNDKLSEEQCYSLSNGLYQVFVDNNLLNEKVFEHSSKQRSLK